MKRIVRTGLWIVTGAVLTLLVLEAILRLLPVTGRGVYGAEYDSGWPMHHLIPNSTFTYSAGWMLDLVNEGAVNNMGYVAPFDYQPGTSGVAVLGDSYIESLMNDYEVTLQGRLGALLRKPIPVMQFGSSGASMPDYLSVARLVAGRFHPQWGVVVISEGDFMEGFSPVPGYHGWDPERDPPVRHARIEGDRSLAARWGRQIALVRYIRYNLKIRPARLIQWQPVIEAATPHPAEADVALRCEPVTLSSSDRALIEAFANELPSQFQVPAERVIVVFDSDRKALYGPAAGQGPECPTRDSAAQALLRERLTAAGIHVVETGELFATYYQRTGRKVDHSPVDWHWNGDAHRLVAEQVAAIINAAPDAPVNAVPVNDHAAHAASGGN